MSKRPWIFLINPFEVNTRGSHRRMRMLSADTHAKLTAEAADADILAFKTAYDPVYNAYALIYSNYDSVAGVRKGNTLNFETIINEDLPTELRKWETAVRTLYPEDSPEEVGIFPNKRTPFLQGNYEDRISAVESLITTLTTNGNFATLVTQVQSFFNVLETARDTQQQKEGLIGQLTALREQQRILLADTLYGLLGGLMRKYKSARSQVAHFFDLSLLRKNVPVVLAKYEGMLNPALFITLGTLPEFASKIKVTIISGGPCAAGIGVVYDLFNGNTMAIGSPGTIVNSIEYFNSAGNRIILQNQHLTLPCQYKVEILG